MCSVNTQNEKTLLCTYPHKPGIQKQHGAPTKLSLNQYSNSRTFLNPYLKLSVFIPRISPVLPPDSFNLFTPSCSKSSIYVHTYGLWIVRNPTRALPPQVKHMFSPFIPHNVPKHGLIRPMPRGFNIRTNARPALIYSPCPRGGQRKRILKERSQTAQLRDRSNGLVRERQGGSGQHLPTAADARFALKPLWTQRSWGELLDDAMQARARVRVRAQVRPGLCSAMAQKDADCLKFHKQVCAYCVCVCVCVSV